MADLTSLKKSAGRDNLFNWFVPTSLFRFKMIRKII